MAVSDADIDLYYPGKGPSGQDRRYWENYLLKLLRADIASGGGGGGVTDGDKGDIIVSGGGTVWTVDTGIRLTLTTVEKDLGSVPVSAGTFTIAGTFTAAKPVLISKAAGPYTGKGTREDEAEMDPITCTGYTVDVATIRVYWQSMDGPVVGNHKFNYAVSA